MKIVVCLLLVYFFGYDFVDAQQGTYRAAVIEYAPRVQSSDPNMRLLENMDEYREFMDQAANQNVQIIAFPEYGLTGVGVLNNSTVEGFSTEVPDPTQQIAPCDRQNDKYTKFLQDLSCAARTYKMYTVINLVEKRQDDSNKTIYHNTNVVFDKNGVVIARYRKINLYNEEAFTPGTNTVTFQTDFGVTFGMFICFDIMFKNSAMDVLSDRAVTDVVYSAAWFSHLPFYGALSIQHGYAKANGVNLLASGLDDPEKAHGGSGIYLADGKIAETYIRGVKTSKMLIQDVPKISARKPAEVCDQNQNNGGPSPRFLGIGGGLPNISDFHTIEGTMSNFTFKSLNLDLPAVKETVCSGRFCCSFNITVNRNLSVQPNYFYKLAVYRGVSQASDTRSVGLSHCALVACLTDNTESCGGRHRDAPIGVTFGTISVKGTFNSKTTFTQPATLKYDLTPLADYTYCKKTSGEEVEIEMTSTQTQNSLLTFGLYGRVFTDDDKPPGSKNKAAFFIANVYAIFAISITVFLLQD